MASDWALKLATLLLENEPLPEVVAAEFDRIAAQTGAYDVSNADADADNADADNEDKEMEALEAKVADARHAMGVAIEAWFGPRCDEHDPDCIACQAWAHFLKLECLLDA